MAMKPAKPGSGEGSALKWPALPPWVDPDLFANPDDTPADSYTTAIPMLAENPLTMTDLLQVSIMEEAHVGARNAIASSLPMGDGISMKADVEIAALVIAHSLRHAQEAAFDVSEDVGGEKGSADRVFEIMFSLIIARAEELFGQGV